jgi:hypothetical protein
MHRVSILLSLIILMMTMDSAAADVRVEVEYEITTPDEIKIEGEMFYSGQEAYDLRCFIDSEYGDGSGDLMSWEVENYENAAASDASSDHTINSIVGSSTNLKLQISGVLGNCESTEEFRILTSGIVVFDGLDKKDDSFKLKFYTADDEVMENIHVRYSFEGYEVTSVDGLSDSSTIINGEKSIVTGFRIPGEVMEIVFENIEDSSFLPSFQHTLAIISIIFIAMIRNPKSL